MFFFSIHKIIQDSNSFSLYLSYFALFLLRNKIIGGNLECNLEQDFILVIADNVMGFYVES